MLTTNIADMTAKIDAHRAADLLMQGTYFDTITGKGCFIGCLTHGDQPQKIADIYGVPVMLTRVLEGIFERLTPIDAAGFFSAIPRAIGSDGKDLSRVVWEFLASELRTLPTTKEIKAVIAGMDLKAAGLEWLDATDAATDGAARAAATDAAYADAAYAADADAAAAYAAVYAAHAAVYAAYAAAADAADADAAAAYAAVYAARAAADAAARAAAVTIRQRDLILQLMVDA